MDKTAAAPATIARPPRRSWSVALDPALWLVAAAAIALAGYAAWWQPPAEDPFAPSFADRWLRPIEINATARLASLPAVDVHALWFASDREGWAACENGVLLKTSDGARTWRRVDVRGADGAPAQAGIYALAFAPNDPQRGYLGGGYGLCLGTRDGGATWQPVGLRAVAEQAQAKGVEQRPAAPKGVSIAAQQQQQQQQQAALPAAGGESLKGSSPSAPHVYSLALTADGSTLYAATSQGCMRGNARSTPTTLAVIATTESWSVATAGDEIWWLGGRESGIPFSKEPGHNVILDSGLYHALAAHGSALLFAGARFWIDDVGPISAATPPGAVRAANDTEPGGAQNTRPRQIWACALGSENAGWAVGDEGRVVRVTRASVGRVAAELRPVPGFERPFYAVWAFSADHAIVAGHEGALFRTRNAGRTWAPLTSNCRPEQPRATGGYWRLPALWFYPAFGLLAWAGYWRWRTQPGVSVEQDAIAAELTTDRAVTDVTEDRLDFTRHVEGLSRYLRNAATQPPLTLAITGAWGSGKSSFMNLLRADLERHGLSTVWFNAWHHQQESQILAPLLQTVRAEAAPPLFTARVDIALRFRLRLLWRRLKAQRMLVFAVLLLLSLGLGIRQQLGEQAPLTSLAEGVTMLGEEQSIIKALAKVVSGGSFVGLVLGLGLLAWRVLVLFGVNPAALLASESGKSSQLALTEQTTFRREFAGRFRDVTEALKPYPLVVFIDDLDRCDAEKVFQILEAINYLVSSGDCFVVLGMSEERVRDCVALCFKDLPPDFSTGDSVPAEGSGNGNGRHEREPATPEDAAWRQHRAHAQNYLEKLVQLRVDVPAPDAAAIRRLAAPAAAASRPARVRDVLQHAWTGWRLGLAWLALAVLAGTAAFFVGGAVAPLVKRTPSAAEAKKGATGNEQPGSRGSASAAPAAGTQAKLRFRERDVSVSDPLGGASEVRVLVLAGAGMVLVLVLAGLAQRELRRRQVTIIRDSREFAEAAAHWSEGLRAHLGPRFTPRALKRFKNRVRYYAMVLRDDRASAEDRIRDRDVVSLGALEQLGIRPGEAEVLPALVFDRPLPPDLQRAAVDATNSLKRLNARERYETAAQSVQMRA